MVYALKTQRLTTRRSPKDRFLSCEIHPSSEEKEGYAGCLFSLIEIDNNQYSSTQIGHSIINTTAREYFRLDNDNASENFELALKKTNEILATYTQEGQTDWIGNLHGIIALLYKDEIHITCVGSPYALLIREGKISNIISQVQSNENDIHPLCTFSNITSGLLEKNDILIFASKNTFSHIDKKELKQLLEIYSLEESSLELANILSDSNLLDTNLILIETTTKEDIANEPLCNIPDTIYLDESNDSLSRKIQHTFRRKLIPTCSKLTKATTTSAAAVSTWLKQKGLPKSHKTLSAIGKSTLPLFGFISRSINRIPKKLKNNKLDYSDTKPLTSKPIKINHYGKFPKINFSKFISYPVIIGALLLILTLSVYIKIRPFAKKTNKPTNNVSHTSIDLSGLQTKFALAKTADKREAITLLEDIITELSGKNLNNSQKDLLKQSQQRYSSLASTTFVNIPTKKTILPSQTIKVFILNNSIYAFSESGLIYKNPINSENLQQISKLPNDFGKILSVTGPTNRQSFLLYTSKQKIFEFQTSPIKINTINSPEDWKSAIKIDHFTNNLYLLDPENNQIWKYLPEDKSDSFKKAIPYLSSQKSLNTMVDLAIDGTIYTLSSNGQIYKIQKNSVTQIHYTKFPSPDLLPKKPSALLTDDENDYFFIIDKDRVIIVDKLGKYQQQLKINGSIVDAYIQPVLHKIWISTKNNIFDTNY